jgi:hypothetical protein
MASNNREMLPEIGGIVHLEHFNFEMLEHEWATLFFMNGLGLTRDPYKRTDETNMGVNIGLQQLHLPRRGRATPPFIGEIGLMVPGVRVVEARLERLANLGKFEGSVYEILESAEEELLVRSPWGVVIRLLEAGSVPFSKPLGLVYVDIPVRPGLAKPLTDFYKKVMAAPVQVQKIDGETTAVVNMGPYQFVRYRERKLKDYNLHDFHIAYYVTHYNTIREKAIKAEALMGDGVGQLFFCRGPFDPKTGEPILDFVQEVRSIYHPDFMRPLVNRWPIIDEPFSQQGDIVRDLAAQGLDVAQ